MGNIDWTTFVVSILGSGVVTAIVNGWMNHQTQIRAIKESGLYTKRAEVLDEMMEKMEDLDRATRNLISFVQYEMTNEDENKRRSVAKESFNVFFGFYKKNRHYLSKKLSNEISNLCEEYRGVLFDFSHVARIPGQIPDIKKWQDLIKKHQGELVAEREKVEGEFRKIIGVE